MIGAEKILARLVRVKQIGRDRWTAACPIDQSRNGRPIAVRALPDGRVLVHAFCGCETGEVLRAVGLGLADLFPERLTAGEYRPCRNPFDAAQVLDAIAHEIRVTVIIAHEVTVRGVDDELEQRLHTVCRRLNAALDAMGEGAVPEEIKRIRRGDTVSP